MRCGNVIRELSAPTGEPRAALLADHLAHCPSCARWAERNARLDQIWEATRPPELSAAAWDRLWADVSESLDRSRVTVAPAPAPALVLAPAVARPWRRSAVAVFALAQAAAILVGFGLAWRQPPSVVMASEKVVDLPQDQDQIPVISLDHKTVRTLAQNGSPNGVDPLFYALGEFESQAELR